MSHDVTPQPARSPRQQALQQLSGVNDATVLSNELGVAATLYLGAEDVLKLRKALDVCSEEQQTLRVLERLKTVPLTRELRDSTRIDESVAGVRDRTDGLVSALASRIVEVWEAQLAKEVWEAQLAREAQQKAPTAPKPCRGQHKAHTCSKKRARDA